MAKIHPTAVVEDGAILADGVEIGPLCYVGANVKIGEGTRLIAHCNVDGHTTIGKNNVLHPFAALGQPAQDHSVVPGAATYLNVGDNIHLINAAVVGGYGEVHDRAILSGLVAIHQFCRVGKLAIISGCSAFSKDVPPFMMAEGRNGGVKMINKVGLSRAGYTAEQINVVKQIFRIYYRSGLIPSVALEKIRTELPQTEEVREFLEFCANSKKGVVPGNANSGHRD